MSIAVTALPPGGDGNVIYVISGYPVTPIQVSKSNLQQDLINFIVAVTGSGTVGPDGPFNYANGNPLTDASSNLYYSNPSAVLADAGGSLYFNTGSVLANFNGQLFYSTGSALTSASGVLLYPNNSVNILADGAAIYYPDGTTQLATSNQLHYGSGNRLSDDTNLYYGDGLASLADNTGHIYYGDGITTLTDGSGLHYSTGNQLTNGNDLICNITAGSLMKSNGFASAITAAISGTDYLSAVGITNGSNATAGNIGEYVSVVLPVGTPVALVTATAKDVLTISLTAGDWDVEALLDITAAGATLTASSAGISSTANTLPTDGSESYSAITLTVASAKFSIPSTRKRFNITTTTTIRLVASATFSAGTVSGFGSLNARRVR